MAATWGQFLADYQGVRYVRHAALTFAGTFAAPGTGYPSNVVSGLAQFVSPDLCFEVPVQMPNSFGPLGPGGVTADSYQQSVQVGLDWVAVWLAANPLQTFALIGYSQGAECASRVLLELMGGSLAQYLPNFIGGITFGNPCRGAHFVAPGVADPGNYRGISSVNMTSLPQIKGKTVWADYVHSPANGDAGLDMYAATSDDAAGVDMTEVYTAATNVQLNNLQALTQDIVLLLQEAGQATSNPAAIGQAIDQGIAFLTAPGGPTAPHISYLGEIIGYSNLVADAVGFLQSICTLTPARAPAAGRAPATVL